jgi:uncharacterized protein (TIGR02117 family)
MNTVQDMKNLLLSLIILLLSGCQAQPFVADHPEKYLGTGENTVYVVSHGWHTGFVIPMPAIEQSIPELAVRFKDIPFLEVGWGDKGFYQAKEITSGLTIQAIFWPTDSVIHSVAVPIQTEDYFPHSEIERLCLTDSELSSLITFISNSFYKDDSGAVVALKNGIYGDSQFYKGVGDYYLMNTCNKWTAKGLKSAGMDISPTFKLTASSIMYYLAGHPELANKNISCGIE